VAEPKLLNEERIVAEKVRCLLRTNERGDWVGRVSDDENWDLELLRAVWGNSLDGANGPVIRRVSKRPNGSKGRGDIPCDIHDNVEHVLDCRVAVDEVVRPSYSLRRIRNQGRGGIATSEGDISSRYVVLFTSRNGDVERFGSLPKREPQIR